ncbi:MAG: hypothetical protein CMK59_07140 [Proteobacteria bacterium]|nr:hypothetical protein [Pseudomonadota bacterium]
MNLNPLEEEQKNKINQHPRSVIDQYSGSNDLLRNVVRSSYEEKGSWVCVRLYSEAKWDNTSPWDDYSGYVEDNIEFFWVGLKVNIPDVLGLEHLNEWAVHRTEYSRTRTKSDASIKCSHKGIQAVEWSEQGEVVVQEALKATTKWSEEKRRTVFDYSFKDAQTIQLSQQ